MKTVLKSNLFRIFAILLVNIGLMSFVASYQQPGGWTVPDKYKNMKNPTKSDPANLKVGKSLWDKHCVSCHGKKGLGDGTKAATLKTHCSDFSAKTFKAQTDGEIFYKTKTGKGEMPAFEKKMADETDIWLLVNYIRSL
ncbi:MAG: cytochrome c [Bacteroidia bacterium]|nr:cytochrome c [Bacteroidia bacterium]